MTSIALPRMSALSNTSRQKTTKLLTLDNIQTEKRKNIGRAKFNDRVTTSRSLPTSNKNDRIDAKILKTVVDEDQQTCFKSSDEITDTKQQRKTASNTRKKKNRSSLNKQKRREETDRQLAQRIQNEEERVSQKLSLDRARQALMSTSIGKAILIVERVIGFLESVQLANDIFQFGLSPVAKDDLVFFAERLLSKQHEFKEKGIPFEVDIGYHYTSEESMKHIQANGLMTRKDRIKNNIQVQSKGAVFGDGVYTANNPTSFMKFGRIGLIVARLQGKPVRMAQQLCSKGRRSANTIIGDKTAKSLWRWPKSDEMHEIVLQHSSQCLPLIRYDRKSLRGHPVAGWKPDAYILLITESLNKILGEIFNGHKPIRPISPLPLCTDTINAAESWSKAVCMLKVK